jgi:hypothetical protein
MKSQNSNHSEDEINCNREIDVYFKWQRKRLLSQYLRCHPSHYEQNLSGKKMTSYKIAKT